MHSIISTYVINGVGVVPFGPRTRRYTPIFSVLHFRVVRARGDRSREGSISKLSLEVKTAVSGFEISPEGEERIIDTYDVITSVSRMYDPGAYICA